MRTIITIILTIIALLPTLGALAQQNEIIYNDFVPDLSIDSRYSPNDTIKLDIDGDGNVDIRYFWEFFKWEVTAAFRTSNGWEARPVGVNESDTIDIITDNTYNWLGLPYTWEFGSPDTGNCWDKIAFRHIVDGDLYCYGWARIYRIDSIWHLPQYPTYDLYKYTLYIDKMAYCTIPSYPLKWGQTTLTGIEENNESNSFATLHPNPTNGQVTITGENLRKAEVVNMLGQQVAIAQGKGETLQVDISDLPVGIYFVNVTDEEGRKCVRKVVKE